MIIEIYVNLISNAEFTWQLNTHACCPYVQNSNFYGQIYLKVRTRNYTSFHRSSDLPQSINREPHGVQRPPEDLFRTQVLYIQTPNEPPSVTRIIIQCSLEKIPNEFLRSRGRYRYSITILTSRGAVQVLNQPEKRASSRYKMKENNKSINFHYCWQYSFAKRRLQSL